MMPGLAVERLGALPRDPGAVERLYLRPLSPFGGAAAADAVARARALPLAGGPLAFALCEVVLGRSGRLSAALADVSELKSWGQSLAAPWSLRLGTLLERVTRRRQPIAGLAFDTPQVMGVVNVTPDSFSDGGDHLDPAAAIAHGRTLYAAGAAIVDIGGESTRPRATPVSPDEERRRVLPVIKALAGDGITVSVDTRHAATMRDALAAGAAVVNDVSALSYDPLSLDTVAAAACPVVLMHSLGDPQTMQDSPSYAHAPLDVYDALERRIEACVAAGIRRGRIIVDPGIGFGKTVEHNLDILRHLSLFHGLGCTLLLGVSRKSFIARLSRDEPATARLPGSIAAALAGLDQGVHIIRVHDVAETLQAVSMWAALAGGKSACRNASAQAITSAPGGKRS